MSDLITKQSDLIKDQFERLSKKAKTAGVEAELLVNGGESLKISFQNGKMDEYKSSNTQIAGWRVVRGSAQGYSFTENLSGEALERSFDDAVANSKVGDGGGKAIPLAEPTGLQDEMGDLYKPEEIAMEKKMEIAKALEGQPRAMDARITRVPYSGYSEGSSFRRILNTRGLDRNFRANYYSGYSYVLAKAGEQSKMAGDSFFARKFSDIDAGTTTKRAVEDALARLGGKQAATGTYTVLLDRDAVQNLMDFFAAAMSAKTVADGMSPLKGRLGQDVASKLVHIEDDPFDRRAYGARPFDDEGTASGKTTLVSNGRLETYFSNLETAQKLGQKNTGHASRSPAGEMGAGSSNLIMRLGTQSREELKKAAPKVLWLRSFEGGLHSGFKSASGDFSLPAEGFMIENGVEVGAVDQFVVSGNLYDLLKDVVGVGNDYGPITSSILVPDLLIEKLSIAGA